MKMPRFNVGNASIRKALNAVAEYARAHGVNPGGRPGWNQTADGWMPPLMRAGESSGDLLWDLTPVDLESGTVSIDCGTILKDDNDLTEQYAIADATDTFEAQNDTCLCLRVTNINSPVVTLVLGRVGDVWQDYPARYDIRETEDTPPAPYVYAYFYPLWSFSSTPSNGAIIVKTDSDGAPLLYATRKAENCNFELIYTIYTRAADDDYPGGLALPAPRFISGHSPL